MLAMIIVHGKSQLLEVSNGGCLDSGLADSHYCGRHKGHQRADDGKRDACNEDRSSDVGLRCSTRRPRA